MRILPMLFNTEMVQAIQEGRKTVTRRVVKPPYYVDTNYLENAEGIIEHTLRSAPKSSRLYHQIGEMPYPENPYKVGDILYIRETWFYESYLEEADESPADLPSGRYSHRYVYKACQPDYPVNLGAGGDGWSPSIHMPKEAARIWLKVLNVKVERLQNMTLDDFLNEGISIPYEAFNDPTNAYMQAKKIFMHIWNQTIPKKDIDKYGWDANPYVWVISFERTDNPYISNK